MSMMIRKLTCAEDGLHEAAISKTGLNDFGDRSYLKGLRVLLDAFDSDMQLTESGWQFVYDWILRLLIARLHAQRGWAEHSEVFDVPIHRPLVIIGLPRTGTTALHKLLSLDPQFQGLEIWLSETPIVRPPRETWGTNLSYRACAAYREALYNRIPELRRVHEIGASDVAECTGVLMQSFVSDAWPVTCSLPTYARWLVAQGSQGSRESYRRYVDVLRLIGVRESHKRWLLKNPFHMAEIERVLEIFPDACIIHTHRDPIKAIPSLCSMLYMYGRDLEGEAAQAHVLGPRQCVYWRTALDRMEAARQKSPTQFFDVDYRRFVADPLSIVHSIYEYFGLTPSLHVEQQMSAWFTVTPSSRHGKHQYTVDPWGITSAQICETFAEYRARHHFD